jgi:hypothetical protein
VFASGLLGRDVIAAEDVPALRGVNAIGGVNNCINCTIAGDATLGGAPASARDCLAAQPISVLERTFGGSFKSVSGQSEVEGHDCTGGFAARHAALAG